MNDETGQRAKGETESVTAKEEEAKNRTRKGPPRGGRQPRRGVDLSAGGKRSGMRPGEDPGDGFTEIARLQPLSGFAEEEAAGGYRSEPAELGGQSEEAAETSRRERGRGVILRALKTLPGGPGVYRMLDRKGEALYVGKARNLKRRVTNYTQLSKLPYRLQRMVSETASLEIVATHTEVEALLLESNLIKRLMPRFNVLLRDDKSFPYILLTGEADFPLVTKHRGQHDKPGDYYGPFASAGAVNRTITALEKAFLLRSCSDAVFQARTRPCLMYHIKRCSAPCVGYIDKPGYAELVSQARDFLSGRSQAVQQRLAAEMQEASEALDFERAAVYRDRIRALAHIQAHQDINVEGVNDADVIALHQEAGQSCFQVFFFRSGRNYGNRAYFPTHDKTLGSGEVMAAFLAQFYDDKPVPRQLLLSEPPDEMELLAEALAQRSAGRVDIQIPQRGGKRNLVEHALLNAREALARSLAEGRGQRRLLEGLAERLDLPAVPERIEVYDNSHTRGGEAYGCMIVAGPEGFRKANYRKFKIRGEGAKSGAFEPGDDYAMMREVLTRRLKRALKEDPERERGEWPDLVILDGGRGQLNVGLEVLAELGIPDLPLIAVAKGPDRDAGRERIFLPDREPLLLAKNDAVLYFIQRLRDEAHRFAIGAHRAGRSKARLQSSLDGVPGIGAKRKKALLLHFGSARAVARAGLADLEAVEGISTAVARKIYDYFHSAA